MTKVDELNGFCTLLGIRTAARNLTEEVRARARIVNRWMQDLGIVEKGNTYVYGDGASLIKEGALHFRYRDTKAEIVGYSPTEYQSANGSARICCFNLEKIVNRV